MSRHLEVETQSLEEILVVEVVAVVGHPVAQKLVHIGAAVAVSTDQEAIAILQVHLDLVEIGCAQDILVASWTDGVEAEGGEDVPGRGLSVVLVSAIAVGEGRVETVHHLSDPILRLPGLTAISVEIDHVLDRLVAMGVVAHVHHLHLAYLVDHLSVVTVVEDGRHDEDAVKPSRPPMSCISPSGSWNTHHVQCQLLPSVKASPHLKGLKGD